MMRSKFALTVNRLSIFAGATALTVMLPAVALGAPTGGAVYRAAPVIVRPSLPQQRGTEQNRNTFTMPFHVNAAPPKGTPETLRLPTPQWYTRRAWTWQPNYVYFASPFAGSCFGNTGNWAAPPQNAAANQSTVSQSAMNDVTIGSLAGDPKHSVLSKSASDIAAALASSNTASTASSSPAGLQIQFQPSICAQQW
jgi:hypothetical protein